MKRSGIGWRLLRNVGRYYALPALVLLLVGIVAGLVVAVTGGDADSLAFVGAGLFYGFIFLTLWLPLLVVILLILEGLAVWLPRPFIRGLGIVTVIAIGVVNLIVSNFVDGYDYALVAVLVSTGIAYVLRIEIGPPVPSSP